MDKRILTYDQIDRQQWIELVQRSKTGTWFQLPEVYDFYRSMPEVFVPFVVGVKQGDTLCALCMVYITKERSAIKQFFTRRAIIVGGPVIANEATSEEVETLMTGVKEVLNERRKGAPIYIETRNFHDYSSWKEAFVAAGFVYKKHLNFHFDCTDKEAMWKRMSETRRRQVRKANGVEISELGIRESVNGEEEIRAYYQTLSDLYKKKVKTPLWPEEVFLEFYRQKKGVYLLVKHEGKVIGGIMCPIWDGTCIYEWFVCGLDAEYKEQYPSVMATWAAMAYANEHGIPMFDIMGAGEPDVPYGVRDFKAEFGGQLVEHGRFLYVNKPLLYRLGVWGVKMLKRK